MGGKTMFVPGFGGLHLILTVAFWAALVMLIVGLFSKPASIVARADSRWIFSSQSALCSRRDFKSRL
jgi:hypothetical protein